MKTVIAALLVALGLCTSNAETNGVNGAYIFLGDSRTVGMNSAVEIDNDDCMFVVAEVGKGYNWMEDTGLPKVVKIIEEHPEYNDWKLIVNLGVNDLGNKDKYLEAYASLANCLDVYVVSVNPCKDSYDNLNSKIDDFNKTMQKLDTVTYIDTCTSLREDGFNSSDGLHYSESTYETIYNMIADALDLE